MTVLAEGGASFGKALAAVTDDGSNVRPETALPEQQCE